MDKYQERAEKILNAHKTAYVFGGVYHIDRPLLLIESIAAALREVAEEAVKFHDNLSQTSKEVAVKRMMAVARSSALEEAVNIVELHYYGGEEETIKRIRALKGKS